MDIPSVRVWTEFVKRNFITFFFIFLYTVIFFKISLFRMGISYLWNTSKGNEKKITSIYCPLASKFTPVMNAQCPVNSNWPNHFCLEVIQFCPHHRFTPFCNLIRHQLLQASDGSAQSDITRAFDHMAYTQVTVADGYRWRTVIIGLIIYVSDIPSLADWVRASHCVHGFLFYL